MVKKKARRSRSSNPAPEQPDKNEEPLAEEEAKVDPPARNLPLLMVSGLAFFSWLTYLLYLALVSGR